jgi:uncharacterized membrane protein YraQ (UPF0718 family)
MKNHDKPFAFRGKYFFLAVCVSYGGLFPFSHQKTLLALQKSAAVLIRILPIIAVVILFTALINYLLQPKQIAGYFGRKNGFKAQLWALAAGVISHGPMYAWYPLLEDLREHGMRDGLIVIFFFARAIKIPLLPMMIDYFGWTFTLVLSFYTMIGALVQGWILELLEKRFRQT